MNPGLPKYLREAFFARHLGMFVSPSWMIMASFAFLGTLVNPGFLLIGAGTEIAYLFTLATNPRFQNHVQNKMRNQLLAKENLAWKQRTDKLIGQLRPEESERFSLLKSRCDLIIEFYSTQLSLPLEILQQHSQSLNGLVWIFLQLLVTKQAVTNMMQGGVSSVDFESKIQKLEAQIRKEGTADDLKKSLESKRDILKMRLQTLAEAKQRLAYVDSELERIEQQVELIREQAVVSKDSQGIANRIDLVSTSLSRTGEWLKEQESLFGSVEKMLEGSPNILSQQKPTLENQ
ncbi:MAG: hypothetical protein WCJ71_06160 [Candidatus Omnitrophota bacterium]